MSGIFPLATLTTGEVYEGNQAFKGRGIIKWCLICDSFKEQRDGHMKNIMGGKHWVCKLHPKAVKK